MVANTYIVLVNWNSEQDTLACIDSLLSARISENQIIVVDNGSVDNSLSSIKARHSGKIALIENQTNIGFAAASNQGIDFALSHGAGWIMLLNNDTIVAKDAFDELGKYMQLQGDYALLSPIIYYFDEPKTIWSAGDKQILGTLITSRKHTGKLNNPPLPEFYPVDFLSGAALLVRRDVFGAVGKLDPTYVMYGEEIDFCWRARQAGFRLACITTAEIWHKVSQSANRVKPLARYLRIRNQIRFYRKYSRNALLPILFLFSSLRALWLSVGDIIARRFELLAPLARGWFEGWWRN